MIEKTIHYVWLGSKEVPEKFMGFIDNWRHLHPEWEIVKWNEENFDCRSNEWVKMAVEQKNFPLAADVIRSYVLYNHGGVYLDCDIELFKPLDDLADDNDFFIGYQADLWFGCAVLGAKKNHIIMREVYRRYLEPCKELNTKSNMLCVLNFTDVIRRLYGIKLDRKTKRINDNAMLLSSDYFFPQHYITRKTRFTENTVAMHHYTSAWYSKGQRAGLKIAKTVRIVFGRRVFRCFEHIARLKMISQLRKEYKRRSVAC